LNTGETISRVWGQTNPLAKKRGLAKGIQTAGGRSFEQKGNGRDQSQSVRGGNKGKKTGENSTTKKQRGK